MSTVNGMGTSASDLQANYLQLLVEQLKCQDPMSPMDNSQMTAQLAQISEVQQLETANTSFSSILALAQQEQAASLIGKQVTYMPDGSDTAVTEGVTGVSLSNGDVLLQTDSGATVSPANVTEIQE